MRSYGAKILELLEKSNNDHISIFEVAEKLKKQNIASIRSIYYGMIFLYSLDIIDFNDFNEPYLVLK